MDIHRGDASMRKIFIPSLIIFFMFGCATIPKGPLRSDEVRLTALKIIETDNKEEGKLYKAFIEYRHGAGVVPAQIASVCTTWSWFWEH
jgi:hypothetical protein